MEHINTKIEAQIEQQKEKFGYSSLEKAIEYLEKGMVFESNVRQRDMLGAFCIPFSKACMDGDTDKAMELVEQWTGRIDARHEASQLELDYLGQIMAMHKNKGYVAPGSDELHSVPHVGLYNFKWTDDELGMEMEHTIKDADELKEYILNELSKEQVHWLALSNLIYKMEIKIRKFLEDQGGDEDIVNYVLPKQPEVNGLGRMKWAPVLRAYFWVSLAAKIYLPPEEEGRKSYPEYIQDKYAEVCHEIDEIDDEQQEVSTYTLQRRDELKEKLNYLAIQEKCTALKDDLWPLLRAFNAIAQWGSEFWSDDPMQISEYPEGDPERGKREFEAVLALFKRKPEETQALESLFNSLLQKAAA